MSDDEGSDTGSPRYTVQFDDEAAPAKYLSKDGHARAVFANRDTYVGEYRNGKRHGHGVYTFANGARYEGEYVDGVKEGRGVMLTLDGSKYDGEWKADKREGRGAYQYASGDVYDGEWKNGQKHGRGTYTYAKNGSRVTGEWSNGQMMHGTWTMADGSRYVGAWHKNVPSGSGLHFFANGNQIAGTYGIDRKVGYKWMPTASRVVPARTTTTTGEVAPVDPLKVASRFIDKALMKIDHFEGIARQFKIVDGAPNFRKVTSTAVVVSGGANASANAAASSAAANGGGDAPTLNIFACGQPTVSGLRHLFDHVTDQYGCDKFVWVNLRTEPIVYVNENSFTPRSKHALNTPMSLGAGVDLSADQLATLEQRLVTKLTRDISHRGNLHTYLKDTYAEIPEDRKNLELQEEVRPTPPDDGEEDPTSDGNYKDVIRTPDSVYAHFVDEGGIDVEYRRLPIPSDRLPPLEAFDALVQLVKNTDPSAALVFNDQMGRGRATYASILATLMRRTAEAVAGADERENTSLGRTDIEGLDLQEYDDAEPNYAKLGQYAVIMRLVREALGGAAGDQIKAEVDDAVERCRAMQHARDAIWTARDQLEKDVAAAQAQAASLTGAAAQAAQAALEKRRVFWTAQAQMLLERYAYLLIFQSYVKANVESEYEQQTFAQYVAAHPEFRDILGTHEQGALADFQWQ